MKIRTGFLIVPLLIHFAMNLQGNTHTWQKVEVELTAELDYSSPYLEVDVWVDLRGAGFSKRCYGFWDGGSTWRVRVMATSPGTWSWTSGSNRDDAGLNGRTGSFEAIDWTESEKQENALRRGMIRTTSNGHAFEYADGTPMFWLADTWWPCMTRRYFWHEDDNPREVGAAEAGFRDYVHYRKSQGYNGCMVIAAFPNWTAEKSDWGGGDWEDEAGNRAFHGEGGAPDLNQLNPAYFQAMDRKVDFLNESGFIPFIETARRDIGSYWKEEFGWPESYARYVCYIYFRYQGNITINSPVHLDAVALSGDEWNEAANIATDRYSWSPFGHQVSANPPGSTLETFGHTDQARWLTFHSVGNGRDHRLFPGLTRMFNFSDPVPCLNNEPYYDGLKWGDTAEQGSDLAAYNSRVALYGSVLSGGLAGHVYGADHIWDGDSEMPGAFLIQSAEQMQHIREFLFSDGSWQDLVPARELLEPDRTPDDDHNMGWAYAMRTVEKDLFLLYFERNCPRATLSGAFPETRYAVDWFDTVTGKWMKSERLVSGRDGKVAMPEFPDGTAVSSRDWAAKLTLVQ